MSEQSFDQLKKRKFWSKRAVASISEIKRNREKGLLSKSEGWRNVVEHELVEAEAVDVLAEKLGLSAEDRNTLRAAAILHDVYKRIEIEGLDNEGFSIFDKSAREQSDWLISSGYPKEVVQLTESVGHTSLQEFNANFDVISTSRKIMHYIDDITLNNDLVSLDERIDALEQNPKYRELNEAGRKIFSGRPYFEVQREISKKIEREFAPKLGLSDPASAPAFIKEVINVRIQQSK